MQVRLKNSDVWDAGEPKQEGLYDARDLSVWVKSLAAGGLIPDANVDLNTLYTNQFVAQYNAFDRGAVVRRANAYRP